MSEMAEGEWRFVYWKDDIIFIWRLCMKPRSEISMQLYEILLERGYPQNLCDLITRNLNTDYAATRMIGYRLKCFQ